jgi:hypothetical protein
VGDHNHLIYEGAGVYRVSGGKLVEHWGLRRFRAERAAAPPSGTTAGLADGDSPR